MYDFCLALKLIIIYFVIAVAASIYIFIKEAWKELFRRDSMTQQEMFEKSFERPSNYFTMSPSIQWSIDKRLGILDWVGGNLTEEEKKRFDAHYNLKAR